MAETVEARLKAQGIALPDPPKPVASYVGYTIHGGLVYVSGQVPIAGGEVMATGLLGRDVSIDEGIAAARLCGINLLAQVKAACRGDLERVKHCVRLGGFVASMPDFIDHPKVVNGASDLMVEVLGDKGQHARAAIGVAALPLNACVEVDGIFAIGK